MNKLTQLQTFLDEWKKKPTATSIRIQQGHWPENTCNHTLLFDYVVDPDLMKTLEMDNPEYEKRCFTFPLSIRGGEK